MALKKVLLGFATTTSFILLVMIAPTTTATTTATTTTTASLQHQKDNVTTTDEPNIPIEPSAEHEEEPREPIPDNENNDTGDIGEPPIAEEPIGPANETINGGNNGTIMCPANIVRGFQTDKKTYKLGEDVIVSGYSTAGGRIIGNVGTPVEVVYSSPSGEHYGSHDVQPEYGDCSFSFSFTIENVTEPGTWEVSAVYPPGDDGEVIGKTQFEVVPAEEAYCHKPPRRELDTGTTTHKLGEDVIVSGLFSPSPRDRENNTPVEVRYKGPEDASYVSKKVQPKYSSYGGCRHLGFEFVIKNVQQAGLWDVSAVYLPLKIDMHTQFVVYSGLYFPRCEDIGSPGNGNADDDYCEHDQNKPDGPIDTWIFQITAREGSASRYIQYGGTIMSSTVDVQFESCVCDGGVSHIDLRIDDGKYKRLAPPKGEDNGYSYSYRTITGLSDGTHTIYLKAVNQAGKADPTLRSGGLPL
jgi:hypothetical protein